MFRSRPPKPAAATLPVPPERNQRKPASRADKAKGEVALPPFDRRFQLGYPVADDPGMVFHPLAPPAPAARASPVEDGIDAAPDVVLVPVRGETLALAMARSQVADAPELVELALRHFAAR